MISACLNVFLHLTNIFKILKFNVIQNNATGAVMPKRVKLMDKACHKINGFSALCQDLDKSNVVNGKSQSTSDDYRHHLAHIALFYNRNPLELTDQEVTGLSLYAHKR